MPDLYQGCELWDMSLVDPDNRRPVDYEKRQQFLEQIISIPDGEKRWQWLWETRYNAQVKLGLTHALLAELNNNAALFSEGDYIPLKVKGKYKAHILAFARQLGEHWLVVAVPLHLAIIGKKNEDILQLNWDDTRIILPGNAPVNWQNLLTGTNGHGPEGILINEIFSTLPLALLKLTYPPTGRSAGVLMHVTSLPSDFGIGDMGPEAVNFIDFLANSGQRYWQMLPLNPVDKLTGYSPYSSTSSMAGNTLLISPELLASEGLLNLADLKKHHVPANEPINFDRVKKTKSALFETAYVNFLKAGNQAKQQQFEQFKTKEAAWLDDYTLFEALKIKFDGTPWYRWPLAYKNRDKAALNKIEKQQAKLLDQIKWLQFVFAEQWAGLKNYCNNKGITLFGDMPFYISYDSADVWAQRQLFNLDKDGNMAGMAGVPPDYFSAGGQLWGMPVYRWDELKKTGYAWWIDRIKKNLEYFDLIRLDHFRAFADYWEVPGGEQTAINGEWKKGPGADFFDQVQKQLGRLPFVAEDLGNINQEVYNLRDQFDLPGMKVLQFAFDGSMPFSDHIPHNYTPNNFAYTGTHDNNTIQGWYNNDMDKAGHKRVKIYTGKKVNAKNAYKTFTALCYSSVARVAILPVQDILGLDERSRMNIPSSSTGNWTWQLAKGALTKAMARRLRKSAVFYNR